MHAQDRIERAELKPPYEQFAIGRIIGISGDEATDISCPIGNAGKRKIQTCRNLAAECQEIRVDVSRPGRDAIALIARKSRTRENEDSLLV